jgi:transcriptional regulator GlxA family with amidase domain
MQIDCQAPIGGLIKAYLSHLAPALGAADPATSRTLVTQLVGLIAVEHGLARDAGDIGREALASAKLVQAKQFIATYLTDPRLTPSWIAKHCGVSLRRLYLLFEPTGVSVGEYVTAERLERCQAMLKDPNFAHRSVTEIAQAAGFESAATFYRAFKRRFGFRPSELRM